MVEFEWDLAKSAATEQSRGIGFARAAEIFTSRTVEWADNRHPYGEARVRVVGISAGELLHVVYTRRGTVIRIISARRANKQERAQWLSSA
ncbi:MAG TPA: BrnT family toxin [Rhodopila sp.]